MTLQSLSDAFTGIVLAMAGVGLVFIGAEAWAISADAEPPLSSCGPSLQAVSAVPASIGYRGECG